MDIRLFLAVVVISIAVILWKKYSSKKKITVTWLRRSPPSDRIPAGKIRITDNNGVRYAQRRS